MSAPIPPLPKNADLILVNSPLRDYGQHPRINDFTLPTLGLAYIATNAEAEGFVVGVLDAEAHGLSISETADLVNAASPRWIGLNLLAPTYKHSVSILQKIDPCTQVMLGGHQAKAMPERILRDPSIPRLDALVLGEAETRVPRILASIDWRSQLPLIYWREVDQPVMPRLQSSDPSWLSPDIDSLPFVDRKFLANDPYLDARGRESAMVASRGCPFDCSFCGAAVSANPDVSIRMRASENIIAEMIGLRRNLGVERIRFVDDLFLANRKVMEKTLAAFVENQVGLPWDATGRINVLAKADDDLLDLMLASGCCEVALGIEAGSDRLLSHIDKKISVEQIERVVERLCRAGINVKGYFILGLPTETRTEHYETCALIERLREKTEALPGRFRCSAFEYRPYPGTPDWGRLLDAGYDEALMLDYEPDMREDLFNTEISPDRDEFNFSTGLQFGEVPVPEVRKNLSAIMAQQHHRGT